jgi:hypothetical protein
VSTEAQSRLSSALDGLTVVYELNDAERILTVVNILREGPTEFP